MRAHTHTHAAIGKSSTTSSIDSIAISAAAAAAATAAEELRYTEVPQSAHQEIVIYFLRSHWDRKMR